VSDTCFAKPWLALPSSLGEGGEELGIRLDPDGSISYRSSQLGALRPGDGD